MTEHPIRIITTEQRRAPWGAVLAVGITVVLAGLGLVIWPFVTASNMLAVIFGVALIANGLAMLVRVGPPAVAPKLVAFLSIAAGLFAIVFAEFTVRAFVAFVGTTLLLIGVIWIATVASAGGARRVWPLVPGILAILAGVFALIWPAVALGIVAFCAGLGMLAFGASLIWGATRMRGVRVEQTRVWPLEH